MTVDTGTLTITRQITTLVSSGTLALTRAISQQPILGTLTLTREVRPVFAPVFGTLTLTREVHLYRGVGGPRRRSREWWEQ